MDLFFSYKGRINRQTFIIGFMVMSAFIFVGNHALNWLGETTGYALYAFFILLLAWCLFLYVPFCVYGKRLHDLGRSAGFTIVMYTLVVIAAIIAMLTFGGAEYFSEFSQYTRKEEIDPTVKDAIRERYIAEQSANMHIIKPLMLIVPVAFTLWLAATPGPEEDNAYGPPPHK